LILKIPGQTKTQNKEGVFFDLAFNSNASFNLMIPEFSFCKQNQCR
jgi:hypothetical protein